MPRPAHFSLVVLCLFLLSGASGLAGAAEIRTGALDSDSHIEILASDAEHTVLRFEVGRFRLDDVMIDGATWSTIDWDGGTTHLERGRPAVPAFHESLAIPDDARMELTVLDAEYRDYPNVQIAPSKGPITRDILPQDVPFEFGDDYDRDAWYPVQTARLGDPYILRDVRGSVVTVEPFQWNAATRTLRVWTRIEVEVKAVGPGETNVLTYRPSQRAQEFEQLYDRHFLNYTAPTRYTSVGEVGSMLVITYDDFATAVQPLVDWKNQMGIPTRLVMKSEVGATASSFMAYIQDAYDNEGVCFILLVGDGPQIPYYTSNGGAADPMLTLLAGSDSYPDAFIGRISAQTISQVETQIERIVAYESAPDLAGDWYARGIAIASNEGEGIGDDGEPDWEHARNYRTDLLDFTYTRVDELYDGTHPGGGGGIGGSNLGEDEDGNPSSTDVSNLLNAGRGLVHYTGHGSSTSWVTTAFSSTAINNLTNDNKLPFVVSVGCVNGQFMYSTCFAETWMRATNGTEPTGAVACYASTVNQQWATPMRAQDEMIDLMCAGTKRTWGGVCFNGSCDMIDHYGSNGISEFKNWTIFGDPSLRLRTAVPQTTVASHGTSVDPNAGSFAVVTEPFALACLSDGGTYIGSAFVDAAGNVTILFDPADLGGRNEVTLTVTGFNLVPFVETLGVGEAVSAPVVAGGAQLAQNQPNPFGARTSIAFSLDREQGVLLEIFDVTGRRVRTLDSATLPAGVHRSTWDGTNDAGRRVPAGTYFYRLTTADDVETRRMVRIR